MPSQTRFLVWTSAGECAGLTDAELRQWRSWGAGGFVCGIGWLLHMGGTQAFASGSSQSLAGDQYSLERQLISARVVSRAATLGLAMYLDFDLVNYFNTATPLKSWFDDAGWSGVVLPDVQDLAAAAKQLGFAGVGLDQELYPQEGDVKKAVWDWDYPGNTHTQQQVRAEAGMRGMQVMHALTTGFPNLRIVAYDSLFPDTWDAYIQSYDNHIADPYADSVQLDFWNGLTSVPRYGGVLFLDATFYKDTGYPNASWDAALEYEANSLFALLSQKLSDWSYASTRVAVSPFGWIDQDVANEGPYAAARSPAYVTAQLAAFRRWAMDGIFGVFAYAPLTHFDYEPYVAAMKSATRPGDADATAPQVTLDAPGIRKSSGHEITVLLRGQASDHDAIRAVYWYDPSTGASGPARMIWEHGDGSPSTGWSSTMSWSVSASVPTGTKRLEIKALDIEGVSTVEAVSLTR